MKAYLVMIKTLTYALSFNVYVNVFIIRRYAVKLRKIPRICPFNKSTTIIHGLYSYFIDHKYDVEIFEILEKHYLLYFVTSHFCLDCLSTQPLNLIAHDLFRIERENVSHSFECQNSANLTQSCCPITVALFHVIRSCSNKVEDQVIIFT